MEAIFPKEGVDGFNAGLRGGGRQLVMFTSGEDLTPPLTQPFGPSDLIITRS